MATYNVIQVASDGSLESSTRPLLDPQAGVVRIKVEACGICRSDSMALHPHSEAELGRVPGHEVVGVIDSVGEGVSQWSIGDRVGVGFLGGQCGVCDSCRRGQFVTCSDQPMTGVSVDGGYAEYAYIRQSGLVRIPNELTAVEAAPLLCAGLTTYNSLLKATFRSGDVVAVQGIGGLGHLGIQYAKMMGAQVVAIARGEEKSDLAKSLGADHYVDSAATDPGAALKALGGAATIIATAASGSSMSQLVSGVKYGGDLMVVGLSPEPIEIFPMALILDGVQVLGSLTGSSIENEDNLQFAARTGISAMIEESPLSGAPAAYDRMLRGAARFRMVLNLS